MMEKQLEEAEIRMKSFEIFLFSEGETGVLGDNYETNSPVKSTIKTNKNVKLNTYKYPGKLVVPVDRKQFGGQKSIEEIPQPRRSSISTLCTLKNPPPPILRQIKYNDNIDYPMFVFTPNQELMQILIRKSMGVKKVSSLEAKLSNAFQMGERIVNILE